MQRGLDVSALVQRHNDALLEVQPVVGADCHSQQPQATDCKDAAQQCQGLPAARAHGDGGGTPAICGLKSPRNSLEEEREKEVKILVY